MTIHLQRKIETIRQMLGNLAQEVETSVRRAVAAVENHDAEAAQRIIDDDDHIDQMEIDLEEECLKALALEQPVAHDLRFVVAVLKVNNDLERIADMAVNLAVQARFLAEAPPVNLREFVDGMTESVQRMLAESLDSLLALDPVKAERVRIADDRIDAMHRRMYQQVETAMIENPHQIPQLMHILNISKNLERIGDLATNIAEDVVYMVRGDIIRHSPKPLARI